MDIKILLVDDDKVQLKMLEKSLSSEGYKLAQATNGKEALSLAKTWNPDLIILDILMPEMDGGDIAKQLKRYRVTRNIPIIFLTSLLSKDDEKYQPDSGDRSYLAKPYEEKILLAEIRRLLA